MKPKIVKFKNGKYGVRRSTFNTFWLEFEFLSRYGFWRDITIPSIEEDYTFDTTQQAQLAIKKSESEHKRYKQIYNDKGKVIK